jgi:hypothetical protein
VNLGRRREGALPNEGVTDARLRRMARERAEFKQHLVVYLVINALLWAINYLTQMNDPTIHWWAKWPTMGWGAALVIHAVTTYSGFNTGAMADREYERLKRKYGE